MGGMHGFGPVRTPDAGLTYHEPWELRPLAIACLIGSGWRPTIEGLAPADYLGSSYYVRWLRAAEHKLVEQGYLTPDDLERWMATLGETARRRPAHFERSGDGRRDQSRLRAVRPRRRHVIRVRGR